MLVLVIIPTLLKLYNTVTRTCIHNRVSTRALGSDIPTMIVSPWGAPGRFAPSSPPARRPHHFLLHLTLSFFFHKKNALSILQPTRTRTSGSRYAFSCIIQEQVWSACRVARDEHLRVHGLHGREGAIAGVVGVEQRPTQKPTQPT
mgnify:CR=1 FL=1